MTLPIPEWLERELVFYGMTLTPLALFGGETFLFGSDGGLYQPHDSVRKTLHVVAWGFGDRADVFYAEPYHE